MTTGRDAEAAGAAALQAWGVDPEGLLALSEPAAVLAADGRVVFANPPFAQLADPAGAGSLAAALAQGELPRRVHVGEGEDVRIFDLTVLPLFEAGWRLVVAADRTVDISLKNALMVSRARFKTLVEVSSDYAWETDEQGHFSLVTPKGLAGRGARELIGQSPDPLLDSEAPQPAVSPFRTPVPVDGVEVTLVGADGVKVCFEVAAVPLYDDKGVWRGARGVCHDVTERNRHRRDQALQRNRDRVFARITNVFRREIDPNDMLQVAASTSTHGFGASGCQIFAADTRPEVVVRNPDLLPVAAFGLAPEVPLVAPVLEKLVASPPERPLVLPVAGLSLLVAPAVYRGRLVGAILLWRSAGRDPWQEADAGLLFLLAGQVAAAIEQRSAYRLLLDASRSDSLTGLLNRRAFYDELKRRYRRLERGGGRAALIYLDMDNFKLVNDVHGHARGDDALRHVADILRHNTRSTDLVARLGGDEFAVWLDNADQSVAVNRAQIFLIASKGLQIYSGAADRPLLMSIGIAVSEPGGGEDLNEFISRADMAMYRVKRSGKGHYGLAPAKGAGAP
jgi:diguanylate cyclase (GGDEF)-like protein/PAS domain S-box-containing protein